MNASDITSAEGQLADDLRALRDAVAFEAKNDRTAFANQAIAIWSRTIGLFRRGVLPPRPDAYEVITASPLGQVAADHNAQAASFGELAIALALLEHGRGTGLWTLCPAAGTELPEGAILARGSWDGATSRPIFLARSVSVVLDLEKKGAFSKDNVVVVHADDVWQKVLQAGTTSARSPTSAPGRTGKLQTRHVSIENMLDSESDVDGLRQKFINEVTL